MPKKLVIVESPAKARTIGKYLGGDFVVESSVGHIRDIPAKANQVADSKRDAWKATRFGIDIDNEFTAMYIVTPDSKQQVTKLRKELKGADALYLATDEDREGGGDRLAPARGSEAEGPCASDGVPRDHRRSHQRGGGESA